MKRNHHNYYRLLLVALLILPATSHAQKTKIACVGNSITEGIGASSGETNYPSVLQRNLGTAKFAVQNFGASGRTLLKNGKEFDGSASSYWDHERYQKALNYQPDIVVIKLGTNDAKRVNWDAIKNQYTGDYIELVNLFKALASNPRIYICYPLPLFGPNNWINEDKVITQEMIPMINQVAEQTGATLIDLHTPFEGKAYLTGDKIHPNDNGYILLANVVAKALCTDGEIPALPADLFLQIAEADRGDSYIHATSSVGGLDMKPLLDNNAKTAIETVFSSKASFTVEVPRSTKITAYSITSGSADAIHAPKSWILEGSVNGKSWMVINRQNNILFEPNETKVFDDNIVLRPYTSWRITISENNGGDHLSMAEWQLFGYDTTLRTSLMDKGGVTTAQFNTNPAESFTGLTDKNVNTKYCTAITGNSLWIRYDVPAPVQIDGYALTSANDSPDRDPVDWALYGSNDGTQWELLDSRKDQKFVGRFSAMDYPAKSSKAYRNFKLNVTKVGTNLFQLAEWQLFESVGTGLKSVNASGFTVQVDKHNLIIISNADCIGSYEIFSIAGLSLFKGGIEPGITVSKALVPGNYLVALKSSEGNEVRKIMVEN